MAPGAGSPISRGDRSSRSPGSDGDESDDDFGLSHIGGSKLQSLVGQLSEKKEAYIISP